MADITKCENKKCKIKELCYRHNAPEGYFQSYANFNDNKVIKDKSDCKYFLKDKCRYVLRGDCNGN